MSMLLLMLSPLSRRCRETRVRAREVMVSATHQRLHCRHCRCCLIITIIARLSWDEGESEHDKEKGGGEHGHDASMSMLPLSCRCCCHRCCVIVIAGLS